MADDGKAIKDLYDDGMDECHRVLNSLDSTPEQVKAAKTSLRKLTALLLAQTIETIEGRTALLNGLIKQLGAVIKEVKVKPPFQDILDKLNGAIGKARKLLDKQGQGGGT